MKILSIVLIISFLFGCSHKEKKDSSILSEKQMTDVMWDLMQADQFVQDFVMKDSTKNKKEESVRLYEEIFRLHHTTAEQFKKSQDYYQADPMRFRSIIDSVAKKQSIVTPPNRPFVRDTTIHRQPVRMVPK